MTRAYKINKPRYGIFRCVKTVIKPNKEIGIVQGIDYLIVDVNLKAKPPYVMAKDRPETNAIAFYPVEAFDWEKERSLKPGRKSEKEQGKNNLRRTSYDEAN